MAQLRDRLQEDIEYIRKVDDFTEEDIHHFVSKFSVDAYLFENMFKAATKELACLEMQLSIHEVTLQVLEPIKYKTIIEDVDAWTSYMARMEGPT